MRTAFDAGALKTALAQRRALASKNADASVPSEKLKLVEQHRFGVQQALVLPEVGDDRRRCLQTDVAERTPYVALVDRLVLLKHLLDLVRSGSTHSAPSSTRNSRGRLRGSSCSLAWSPFVAPTTTGFEDW